MYHILSDSDKPDIKNMFNRISEMMRRGINIADLNELYNRFYMEQQEIAGTLYQSYGIRNPNSSQQIAGYISSKKDPVIYEACCIDGKWTSNKEALLKLSNLGYEFANDLLAYRRAKKYAESIKSMMSSVSSDHYVHPSVSLSKTNRINYVAPALMNIPKPLLWHIIKPMKDGNILISADIKNQEPNILINMLGADELKPALSDPKGLYEHLFSQPFEVRPRLNIVVVAKPSSEGAINMKEGVIPNSTLSSNPSIPPIYYMPDKPLVSSTYINGERVKLIDVTNVLVYAGSQELKLPNTVMVETITGNQYHIPVIWDPIDIKKLKKTQRLTATGRVSGLEIRCEGIARSEFKVAWNAMTYGASNMGIKRICKHIDGDAVYKYFTKIPEFKAYRSKCTKLANAGTQEIRTYFGTRLITDEEDSKKLRRVLMDLPVQGTGADILSMLIMHFDKEVQSRNLTGLLELYYTRHDEMIFEANGEWVKSIGIDAVKALIHDIIDHQVDNWVPFKIEVNEVEASKLYNESDDPFDED